MGVSPEQERLRALAAEVARGVSAPHAEEVDREGRWPAESVRALGEAGLLGLHVPKRVGGLGQGYLALALVTEELGRACSSSALVFGMHCVGTQVLAAKATPYHAERYLQPIARGEHVTTLALSEPGTGVHFYIPHTTFRREKDHFAVNGTKGFVTSGGHADSYVISAVVEGAEMDPGSFSCLLVEADSPGLKWQAPWNGLGMRGNSSRTAELMDARVPAANLLGEEGDETWYAFEVIAPFFITGMAGTYLGIAQAALDLTVEQLGRRSYEHTGEVTGSSPLLSHRLGELWIAVERARRLLYHAAMLADAGAAEARPALLACKAEVADTVVHVTNEAMTLTGGRTYGQNAALARLLRDARASHIMSPTTDLLKTWLGRTLLGLPLL